MKIAIDARLLNETGVGRYIRNLISNLGEIDVKNSFIVYVLRKDFDTFRVPNARWIKKIADIRWHSVAEQIRMPLLYLRDKPDIVHVPYFNAPVLFWGKLIVTIHDLTILHTDTGKASTLPYWKYKLRRIGYRVLLWAIMKKAGHILTVSQAVKRDILSHFNISETQISVTYEGIDDTFVAGSYKSQNYKKKTPYFLYVGNVYPHKNIEILLEAFHIFQKKAASDVKLLFVGPSDYFYSELSELIKSLSMNDTVEILHNIGDPELGELYDHAVALLFPSRMEGFGLPALEALSRGCRVIASDIPVFREILSSHAFFADSSNAEAFARVMSEVFYAKFNAGEFRKSLVPFLSQYNWKKMAQETFEVYEKTAGSVGV